jgi:hypothetical protein
VIFRGAARREVGRASLFEAGGRLGEAGWARWGGKPLGRSKAVGQIEGRRADGSTDGESQVKWAVEGEAGSWRQGGGGECCGWTGAPTAPDTVWWVRSWVVAQDAMAVTVETPGWGLARSTVGWCMETRAQPFISVRRFVDSFRFQARWIHAYGEGWRNPGDGEHAVWVRIGPSVTGV